VAPIDGLEEPKGGAVAAAPNAEIVGAAAALEVNGEAAGAVAPNVVLPTLRVLLSPFEPVIKGFGTLYFCASFSNNPASLPWC